MKGVERRYLLAVKTLDGIVVNNRLGRESVTNNGGSELSSKSEGHGLSLSNGIDGAELSNKTGISELIEVGANETATELSGRGVSVAVPSADLVEKIGTINLDELVLTISIVMVHTALVEGLGEAVGGGGKAAGETSEVADTRSAAEVVGVVEDNALGTGGLFVLNSEIAHHVVLPENLVGDHVLDETAGDELGAVTADIALTGNTITLTEIGGADGIELCLEANNNTHGNDGVDLTSGDIGPKKSGIASLDGGGRPNLSINPFVEIRVLLTKLVEASKIDVSGVIVGEGPSN